MSAGVLALVAVLAGGSAIPTGEAGGTGTVRLRPTQPLGRRLVSDAIARSPTVRRLVADLERSDVIVYLELRPDMPGGQVGSLRFIAPSATDRFLGISLNRHHDWSTLIAFLGHELQHASEIAAAPEVRSADTLRGFYRRTGIRVGPDAYDSDAARMAGQAVHAELRGRSRATTGRMAALDRRLPGSASISINR